MKMKSQLQSVCLALFLLSAAIVQSGAADTLTIPPGQTGILVPDVFRDGSGSIRFGLSLDISSPLGFIEIRHLASDNTVLATELLSFDSSGSGAYQFDMSYLSVSGLVDIESLFPGLNLVGQLGDQWVGVHTELNSGKAIWSYPSGKVMTTLDPNAGEAEVQTPNFQGVASAPLPLLELPATIAIANLTPGTIVACSVVPEPASVALMLIAGTLAITIASRR